MTLERRLVDIVDGRLEVFDDHGEGLPVCHAHPVFGWTSASTDVREEIGGHCRVVLVNLRGQGDSSPVRGPADLTFQQMRQDLERVRESLGLDRWVVVARSMGSPLGVGYALGQQASLAGLILCMTAPSWPAVLEDESSLLSPRFAAWQADIESARARIAELTGDAGRWVEVRPGLSLYVRGGRAVAAYPGTVPPRFARLTDEWADFDATAALGELRVPTLVVGGRQDPLTPLRHAESLHRAIAGSDFVVLEASGHSVAADDLPTYHAAIRRFLAERAQPALPAG